MEAKFGKINVLVNNAGIAGVSKPTHEITLEEWQKVININQNGVFLYTKHVILICKKLEKWKHNKHVVYLWNSQCS